MEYVARWLDRKACTQTLYWTVTTFTVFRNLNGVDISFINTNADCFLLWCTMKCGLCLLFDQHSQRYNKKLRRCVADEAKKLNMAPSLTDSGYIPP